MARRKGPTPDPPDAFDLTLGPPDGVYTDAELEAAWEGLRDDLLDLSRPWAVPWGFFRFDCGLAEVPHDPDECERIVREYRAS